MTKAQPRSEVFCIDCGWSAGWIEGRGRRPLRCFPCYSAHLTEYNRLAKRKERLTTRLGRAVNV